MKYICIKDFEGSGTHEYNGHTGFWGGKFFKGDYIDMDSYMFYLGSGLREAVLNNYEHFQPLQQYRKNIIKNLLQSDTSNV